jgi:hypothetical protein
MKVSVTFLVIAAVFVSGCAANSTTSEGAKVELVNDKPTGNCKALGEVIGSQEIVYR